MDLIFKALEHGGHFAVELVLIVVIAQLWRENRLERRGRIGDLKEQLEDLREQKRIAKTLARALDRRADEEYLDEPTGRDHPRQRPSDRRG